LGGDRRPRREDFKPKGDAVYVNAKGTAYPAEEAEYQISVLDWGKAKRAQEAHERYERLKLWHATDPEDQNKPTPETVAKSRANIIDKLFTLRRLSGEQKDAANEILMVWEAIGRGMWSGRNESNQRVSTSGRWPDPVDRMSDTEARYLTTHYTPWMREAEQVVIQCRYPPKQKQLTAAILTWDMVIMNVGPDAMRRVYGMRKGKPTVWLQRALWRYAEIADNVDPRKCVGTEIWKETKI
jgi:hypothetical protein